MILVCNTFLYSPYLWYGWGLYKVLLSEITWEVFLKFEKHEKIWKKMVKNRFFWITQEQSVECAAILNQLCIRLVWLNWYQLWVFCEDVCEVSR